jgi:pimeloyl-ACP methyl ester carboxylesterase
MQLPPIETKIKLRTAMTRKMRIVFPLLINCNLAICRRRPKRYINNMPEYTKIGSGPVILYVPGLDGTGKLFARQIEPLSTNHTVITSQFRNEASFSYKDLENDLLEILNAEELEKATIVAESFGGTIALHFALDHQDRVDQLILVNTFPYFRKRKLLWLGRVLLPFAFVPFVRKARDVLARPVLLSELVDEKGIEVLFKYSWSHAYPTYRQRMKLIASHDVRKNLSEIQVPVTIIAAGRDKIVPSVKEAKLMAEKIPNAKVHILPDHGHACLLSGSFHLDSIL